MTYKLLENYSIDRLLGYEIDQLQEHLIVAVSDSEVSDRDFQCIEKIASDLSDRSLSFVILSEKLTYEVLPETVNLCPTLEEAIDLIEFEEIQRDLGL
jgi:hypothetical protein